jgi:hypothetical protein
MARNKHSAALFEVIHSAKRPGLLRTPKWWFKGDGASPAPAAQSDAPPVAAVEEPVIAVPVMPTSSYGTRSASAGRQGLRLNRERNEVTMRMRFGTAVVGGFVVLVALGLAYVVGQHVANGPKTAEAADISTDEIRLKPPVPNTLDVSRHVTKPASAVKTAATGVAGSRRTTDAPLRTKPLAASGDALTPDAKAVVAGPRNPDKNYILVRVYEPKDRKLAEKACDVLGQAGVACSIEKVPTGYSNNAEDQYVAVITQQGFTGPSDPEGKACEQRIIQVATKANLKLSSLAFFKGTKLR